MNTYLYAPKDDSKHRAYWRELYSVEESEALKTLIESAQMNQINFIYAISPGLDVTYSSQNDQMLLKRKLDQVKEFGCKYFAILFDDIDSEMQQSDKVKFKSFAEAQSYLTNILYEHLNQPEQFYFCPTEYCDVFAKPNVDESEYLRTIGEKLLPNIRILWTGPGIVSEYITIKHIKKISQILRRKPLIWDNFHANDYDLNCIFLGPFTSRSPNLRRYICGMLTNPNCEFECNYVPIYSLALWSHSIIDNINEDFDEFDVAQSVKLPKSILEHANADIEMLVKTDFDDFEDVKVDDSLLELIDQNLNNIACDEIIDLNQFYYEPEKLMPIAIKKWLPIINEKQDQVIIQKEELKSSYDDAELSVLNSTTKHKAQLVACNSLVIKQIDEKQQEMEEKPQQGDLVVINNGNGDIVDFCSSSDLQQPTITSLSMNNKNIEKKKKNKMLKKFLLNNLKKRRKRERVDGGEFYKHRKIRGTSRCSGGIEKKKIVAKLKKKNKFKIFEQIILPPSTTATTLLVATATTTNNNNVNDDDMDDVMMGSTRLCSSTFLSPVAQNMLIDETTTSNIDLCISSSSLDNQETQAGMLIPNDIELLSIPPMSLPPSTRASSIASYKSSSSSSMLSIRNKRKTINNSPKKRKKYEPLVALSSSSKASFKARKKLKKCVNNKIICTSPMDLGMLSDATIGPTNFCVNSNNNNNNNMMSTNDAATVFQNESFNEFDLKILIDLYYLPFEYGKFSIYLLKEFKWLKLNLIRLNLLSNDLNQINVNNLFKFFYF